MGRTCRRNIDEWLRNIVAAGVVYAVLRGDLPRKRCIEKTTISTPRPRAARECRITHLPEKRSKSEPQIAKTRGRRSNRTVSGSGSLVTSDHPLRPVFRLQGKAGKPRRVVMLHAV